MTRKSVSLFELSVHERVIWLDGLAVATRFVGAAGEGPEVGVGVGVLVIAACSAARPGVEVVISWGMRGTPCNVRFDEPPAANLAK
jgi:hypothetical protein